MVLVALLAAGCHLGGTVVPPRPAGAVPSERQVRWHQLEAYAFIHFTINTFTDKEWGYGDESPALFAPQAFDAEQIVRTVKEAGLRGVILTAKHHDGFCLWPSRYTEHSIKNSPYRNGKGDIVREMAEACRKHDLAFGIYLSPWDRNHAEYGRPEYLTYYRNQLRELLTEYGPIFEVWFDGANGGDGYYGGARETRTIDKSAYYDWPTTFQMVRELQPQAVVFSNAGPDVRWVGNEDGLAGVPCWPTIDDNGDIVPGSSRTELLSTGTRHGKYWRPAEADVSIRPGWFYHQNEDARVKTVADLTNIYFASVGRGASLNLNIPPDRRGQFHETDVKVLRAWAAVLRTTFAHNLAGRATVTAGNVRGNSTAFSAQHLIDGDRQTYWATDDEATAAEVVFDLGQPVKFNVVELREYLPLGCRIDAAVLESWQDGQWRQFATCSAIGSRALLRFPDMVTTKVRLRVTDSASGIALASFGLYLMPGFQTTEPMPTPAAEAAATHGSSG